MFFRSPFRTSIAPRSKHTILSRFDALLPELISENSKGIYAKLSINPDLHVSWLIFIGAKTQKTVLLVHFPVQRSFTKCS